MGVAATPRAASVGGVKSSTDAHADAALADCRVDDAPLRVTRQRRLWFVEPHIDMHTRVIERVVIGQSGSQPSMIFFTTLCCCFSLGNSALHFAKSFVPCNAAVSEPGFRFPAFV